MSLRGGVRCIFVYVYFPHLLRGFPHILTCTCNYILWPLVSRKYNLSISNRRHGGVQVDEARLKAHGRDRPRLQVRFCFFSSYYILLLIVWSFSVISKEFCMLTWQEMCSVHRVCIGWGRPVSRIPVGIRIHSLPIRQKVCLHGCQFTKELDQHKQKTTLCTITSL
jgi:hypothetical protein